jgi:hypothetical protein
VHVERHRGSIALQYEYAGEKHRLGTEADGVADTAGALEPGAASATVAECVHRDTGLARLRLRARGVLPGLCEASALRLAGAAFESPALGAACSIGIVCAAGIPPTCLRSFGASTFALWASADGSARQARGAPGASTPDQVGGRLSPRGGGGFLICLP